MRYLLHIGTNKTGTSSLQRIFFDNRALLSEYGIAYPMVGIENAAHHNVSRALKGVSPNKLGMSANWMEQLHNECLAHDLCLLSSENFHTIQKPAYALSLCPRGQTKVIVYIREHAVYLTSWYQQAIQSRNTSMTLEEFIEHHSANYMKMINGWVEAYGQENVIVKLYDRSTLKDGDIISDFFQYFDPTVLDKLKRTEASSNPSIAGNLLFFKRMLNIFLTKPESLSIANEIAGMVKLDNTFEGKIQVPKSNIDRIRFLYRGDKEKLNQLFGLDMKPLTKEIEGTLYPNYDSLSDDFLKIEQYARQKNFKTLKHFTAMKEALRT